MAMGNSKGIVKIGKIGQFAEKMPERYCSQRLFRKEVGVSAPKCPDTIIREDIVYSHRKL